MSAPPRMSYRVKQTRRFGTSMDSARQPVLGGKRPDPYSKLRFWRLVAAVLAYMVIAETLVLAIR